MVNQQPTTNSNTNNNNGHNDHGHDRSHIGNLTVDEDVPSAAGSTWSPVTFLDEHVAYLKYPFLIAGVVGAVIVARSLRLARRFTNAKAIPKEFIRKQFTLYGKILEVKKYDGSEQSVVVFVHHTPILRGFRWKQPKSNNILQECLEIHEPGISLKSQYYPQVYKKLTDQKVRFILQDCDQTTGVLEALISVRILRFKLFPQFESVASWSVKNGFATTTALPYPSHLRDSPKFMSHYSKLLELQKVAIRKRRGCWNDEDSATGRQGLLRRLLKFFFKR